MIHMPSAIPSAMQFPSVKDATVTVSLADIMPLLLHASQTRRGWLHDFTDDVVQVSQDLYEVLLAYQDLIANKAA